MGLISSALTNYGTTAGKVKSIIIAQNGTVRLSDAEKEQGYIGYNPVIVDVKKIVSLQELSVTEPGVYHVADYGVQGFDPVNVSSIYKDLYNYTVNGGTDNSTDDGINVPNSIPTGNTDSTNGYLNISAGDFDTVTNSGNSVQIKFWVEKTPHPIQEKYWTLSYKYTVTNLNTGESVTGNCYSVNWGWNEATTKEPLFEITSITYGSSICEINYSMTRYNEDGTVRDTNGGFRKIDHGSVGAGTYTDSWIVSNSAA
jgi:hypothetical protein